MEFSHWFAGFCAGGGLALMWSTVVLRRESDEWLSLCNRLEALVFYWQERCEQLEDWDDTDLDDEEYDPSEAWKYN